MICETVRPHLRQSAKHTTLRRHGRRLGHKRVERLMCADGRQGVFVRERWQVSPPVGTESYPGTVEALRVPQQVAGGAR